MDESVQMPMTESPAPEKGLAFKGLWQVFYEPTAFFTKIKNNPKVLWPWLLGVIFIAIFLVGAAAIHLSHSIAANHTLRLDTVYCIAYTVT